MNLLRAERGSQTFSSFRFFRKDGEEGRNDSRISPPPRSSTLLEKKRTHKFFSIAILETSHERKLRSCVGSIVLDGGRDTNSSRYRRVLSMRGGEGLLA